MRAGEAGAKERFVEAVYLELKKLARQQLRGERAGQSLQASALVNDVYLRMLGRDGANWENRAHFFWAAAANMRRILIERARARKAQKRGGEFAHVEWNDQILFEGAGAELEAERLIALDDALAVLAGLDPRQARIVELRFFVGVTAEETAEILGISRRTVMREWSMARAFLHERIGPGKHPNAAGASC